MMDLKMRIPLRGAKQQQIISLIFKVLLEELLSPRHEKRFEVQQMGRDQRLPGIREGLELAPTLES
jgi:hypothetical protein